MGSNFLVAQEATTRGPQSHLKDVFKINPTDPTTVKPPARPQNAALNSPAAAHGARRPLFLVSVDGSTDTASNRALNLNLIQNEYNNYCTLF